jgi:predicted extracellular nuclease
VIAGSEVQVTGRVAEYRPAADPTSPPLTQIVNSAMIMLLSSGNNLPMPEVLTSAETNPAGSHEQLEKYEGMLVTIPSLTVVSPTGGFYETGGEANAIATSNGAFYAVITGVARPFREPGVETENWPANIPRFDGNPERLRVDSDALAGATKLEVTSGATLTNVTGVLDYSFRCYTLFPLAGNQTQANVVGNITATPVPEATTNEFTVASFNLERFFDTTDDANVTDVALTADGFNRRLQKASLTIRNVLRSPDIIGVEEVENLTTLQTLASKINSDAVAAGQSDPKYVAYLEEGNDPGGIDVGFLVKSTRVNVVSVTQEGKTATFVNPANNQSETLNDRPPLVLKATLNAPDRSRFALTVIVNHLRSLNGIEDATNGNRVRHKRRAQAEYLAQLIQTRQIADPTERIISIGDYNAFQLSDGLVDVIGTVKGTPTPAEQVVLASSDLVNPDLTDLIELVTPATQRYSYSFNGNAQAIDHALVNAPLLKYFSRFVYARTNADFPETWRNDSTRPERISDHDPAVAYFTFTSPEDRRRTERRDGPPRVVKPGN